VVTALEDEEVKFEAVLRAAAREHRQTVEMKYLTEHKVLSHEFGEIRAVRS